MTKKGNYKNRLKGRINQKKGDRSETATINQLKIMGFRKVRKIHTGFQQIPIAGSKKFVPTKKVDGDISAVHPQTGRSVQVEVKNRDSKTLPRSAFEDHQIDSLDEQIECGGISIIAWLNNSMLYVMDYKKLKELGFGQPIGNGKKRRSIDLAMAKTCEINDINDYGVFLNLDGD